MDQQRPQKRHHQHKRKPIATNEQNAFKAGAAAKKTLFENISKSTPAKESEKKPEPAAVAKQENKEDTKKVEEV